VRPGSEYPESDMRSFDDRWQGKNYEANVAAVGELKVFAQSKGVTVTQLALAWLLVQGDDIVPIPGTRKVHRVEENAGAAAVELTAADLERIREILPHGSYGSRYPTSHMPEWARS
jgi:aryl-alcohol dehydrogenase-like predicted oxidoreductase